MSIQKIKVFPEITSLVIENNTIKSIVQEYNDIDKITKHIQACIKIVRNYDKKGYYNLARPSFVDDVITTFTNLELTKKQVIRVNNFIEIIGLPECNRIWQLPDEMKVQTSQRLHGFYVSYDTENWEHFTVTSIQD